MFERRRKELYSLDEYDKNSSVSKDETRILMFGKIR